jgi:hypothetical protein
MFVCISAQMDKLQVSCQSELFVKKNGMIVKIKHNLLVINNLILENKKRSYSQKKGKDLI